MNDLNGRGSVTLVIPAHNESSVIESTVLVARNTLSAFVDEYEIVIVDNASTDDLPQIAERLSETYTNVRWVQESDPGRGLAVATGFEAAQGDVLAFIDADLATDMKHLEQLIECVRSGEYDIATGSRWIPGHEADRPLRRTIVSKGFNFLSRIVLSSSLRDHQCGFKALSREVFEEIIDDVQATHWFWDTEMLVLADHYGYRINEFPVEWEPQGDSAVDLMSDVPKMALQLFKLGFRLRIKKYFQKSEPHAAR